MRRTPTRRSALGFALRSGLLVALLAHAAATASAEPRRVVAIGGSITETVFALGRGDRLVAVDTTSLFPQRATRLPNVGYMRALSAEPILALAPDPVLPTAMPARRRRSISCATPGSR